jgi:hypothetical protein
VAETPQRWARLVHRHARVVPKMPLTPETPEDTAAWLYDAVIRFLQGPLYTTPLMGFIDAKCVVFDESCGDENKLEFTVIHNEFKELVDNSLCDFLSEIGVTPERFAEVVETATRTKRLGDFVATSILTVDDFNQFKAMMVKRNQELLDEVLVFSSKGQTKPSETCEISEEAVPVTGTGDQTWDAGDDDDATFGDASKLQSKPPVITGADVAFEKALKMSLEQFEKDQQKKTKFESNELNALLAEAAAVSKRTEKPASEETRDVRKFVKNANPASEFEEECVEGNIRSVDEKPELTTKPDTKLKTQQPIDDGFDDGAVEQAIAMSKLQFDKDRTRLAAEDDAVRVAIAETERAAIEAEALRVDTERKTEELRLETAHKTEELRLETERKTEELRLETARKELAAKAALEAQELAVEKRELAVLEMDTKNAVKASLAAASLEAADLERERAELEQALELSLETEQKCVDALKEVTDELSEVVETESTSTEREEVLEEVQEDATQEPTQEKESERNTLRNALAVKAPLGVARTSAAPAVPTSLASLKTLPPLRSLKSGMKSAGYKSVKQTAAGGTESSGFITSSAGSTQTPQAVSQQAVRQAAVLAAQAQKQALLVKQLELKKRAAEAAARAAVAAAEAVTAAREADGMDDADVLETKRIALLQQRGLLVARKALEREREVAAFAATRDNLIGVNSFQKSNAAALADGKENQKAPPPSSELSEQEQQTRREALRAELARRMKQEMVVRNAWAETESYV